jgi:hypothetical protein
MMNRFENDDYDSWAAQKYDEAVESWCLMADEAHERLWADLVDVTDWAFKSGITIPVIFEKGLWQALLYAGDYDMHRIATLAKKVLLATHEELKKNVASVGTEEVILPLSLLSKGFSHRYNVSVRGVMNRSGEYLLSLETYVADG